MNEEEKAIQRLNEIRTNYNLSGEDLHYAEIIYYLIINLKKKADHYKHLYNELKKQKDDVVEYIKNNKLFKYVYDEEELFEIITDKQAKNDLLRMLGEIDNE